MAASIFANELTKPRPRKLVLAGIGLAICATSAPAGAATFTLIDPPGAVSIWVAGINSDGIIAGHFGSPGGGHAFVRSVDGVLTVFDPKGFTNSSVSGINDKGWVAGDYSDSDGMRHGFIRKPNGHIETFDGGAGHVLFTRGINRRGEVCGLLRDAGNMYHGFLRAADGTFIAFDPPGSIGTFVTGANDSGAVTGYFDNSQGDHGFVRAPDGNIAAFDPPDSIETLAFSINSAGSIAGADLTSSGTVQEFIRDAAGGFTSFDLGADSDGRTWAGINAKGEVASWYYYDADFNTRGFLRKPNGKIKPFDAPGTQTHTIVSGINDKGMIVGTFIDNEGTYHGFLRTP